MTLRDALAYSRNRVTAQLMEKEGLEKVVRLARAMGVRESPLDAVPSLALGTSPVTLKEMASAYSTIANRGAYIEPRMVRASKITMARCSPYSQVPVKPLKRQQKNRFTADYRGTRRGF